MIRRKRSVLFALLIVVFGFFMWSFSKQSIVLMAAPGETVEVDIPTKNVFRQLWIGESRQSVEPVENLSNREPDHLTQRYVCQFGAVEGPYIDTRFKDGERQAILINKCNEAVKLELSWFNFAPWNEFFVNVDV